MIIFEDLKKEDFNKFTGHVFCMGVNTVLNESITLEKVEDPTMGECAEYLDILIYNENGSLHISPEIQKEFNNFRIRDVINNYDLKIGDSVKVVIRRMSNMIMDVKKSGYSCVEYFVCDEGLDKALNRSLVVSGRLAAGKIKARNIEEAIKALREHEGKYSERYVKLLEGLNE